MNETRTNHTIGNRRYVRRAFSLDRHSETFVVYEVDKTPCMQVARQALAALLSLLS